MGRIRSNTESPADNGNVHRFLELIYFEQRSSRFTDVEVDFEPQSTAYGLLITRTCLTNKSFRIRPDDPSSDCG